MRNRLSDVAMAAAMWGWAVAAGLCGIPSYRRRYRTPDIEPAIRSYLEAS